MTYRRLSGQRTNFNMSATFKDSLHRLKSKELIFALKFTLKVLGVILLIRIIIGSYDQLDKSGWIEHSVDTPVAISGEWLQGEYRSCLGILGATGKQKSLACITDSFNAPEHVLPVTFWGRTERPDRVKIIADGTYLSPDTELHWKCQRLSDSLKCWAE